MIELHHANLLRHAERMRDRSVKVTITDPPYLAHTHESQRRGAKGGAVSAARPISFDALTPELRREYAVHLVRVTERWGVVFSDVEGWEGWRQDIITAGGEYMRQLVWVRGSLDLIAGRRVGRGKRGSPQFTGDRPGQGHEVMVLWHAPGKASRWNGRGARADGTGGKTGGDDVYYADIETEGRIHDAQKPLALIRELVRDYSDPGDLIFDPFAGSGTTLIAARIEGRPSLGLEVHPGHHRRAAARCGL